LVLNKIRIWPLYLTLVIALALEITPLINSFQMLRPPIIAMVLIYWIMMWPERIGLGTAFLFGIGLDILHGQILGQNAMSLTIIAYLTIRFHLQIRIFPLWQLTIIVFALLTSNAIVHLLIDGVAGTSQIGFGPWIRILFGTLTWPILMAILDRIRIFAETKPSHFD
ncbi:MAG: rod shape-determining protein MreD, partial [Pseudomonadota bacterium]|nr:rod shape-determining protein MreD [Pseudomonadota bacterium]